MKNNSYIQSFIVVLIAGIIWSFGVIPVRHLINVETYIFEYLFFRGLTTAIIITLFLFFREGLIFCKNFFYMGVSGYVGSFFLTLTFIAFIFSISKTTVAVTLFMLATIPFIAALLGYLILGEILKRKTLFAMLIATIGVFIIIYNDFNSGGVAGALLGFLAAFGFASYTVAIRWNLKTPKFTTVLIAGLICALFSIVMLDFSFQSLEKMPIKNVYLSILHGLIVSFGFILYTFGAKFLPSAELTFLTLLEIVGGIFWVWVPIFGINETPSFLVILGGFVIILAITYYGYTFDSKGQKK